MTLPVGVLVGIAGLAAAIDWVAVWRENASLQRWAKPAVMIALIGAAVVANPSPTSRTLLLTAALGASLAGDVLLLPPIRFTGGLVAFLVAHVAYLALFLRMGVQAGAVALGLLVAGLVAAVAGRPILGGARRVGMVGPVAAYFAVILLMAVAATATGSLLAATGAWLFVGSDTVLGWDRFAAPPAASARAAAARRLAVIVAYHAAQVLLTVAVLRSPAS